jgi:hypothetical protein
MFKLFKYSKRLSDWSALNELNGSAGQAYRPRAEACSSATDNSA